MVDDVELKFLGGTAVVVAGDTRPAKGQVALLMSLLAVRLNGVVGSATLTDAIWPEGASRTALHQLVSRVRKLLGPDGSVALETTSVGYRLSAPLERVDLSRFETAVILGREALVDARPEEAERSFRRALDLWGEPFDPVGDHEDLISEANRLRELHASLEEELSEAILAQGHHVEEIDRFQHLVDEAPVRERRWCQLMTALYRSGRQTDALRCAQLARQYLADEIGVGPGEELLRIETAILTHDESLGADRLAREGFRLPADVTSFVGRRAECAELRQMTLDHRLVTVWGPGGVGKSRIALRVARDLAASTRDGAISVGLSGLDDLASIVAALAVALGVTRRDHHDIATVVSRLARCDCLVVLDNCEHVSAEVAVVAERIVTTCPAVRVVVTSQHPLGILGEARWRLPQMSTSDDGGTSDAEQLFLARAMGDDRSGWSRDEIVALCQRLDGLPLAVELAAALTPALSPGEILARLDDRFELLAVDRDTMPPHHRTLESTIEWSVGLLSPAAATLLEQVSVFVGGFTVDGAEAVADNRSAGDLPVVSLLNELVSRSLAGTRPTAVGTRYQLLESVQLFAAQRLAASGRATQVADAHLRYYLTVAHHHGPAVLTDDGQAMAALMADWDNLRAALDHAMVGADATNALDLAIDVTSAWLMQGMAGVGRAHLDALIPGGGLSARTVRARLARASLAAAAGEFVAVEVELAEVAGPVERFGLEGQAGWAHFWVGRSLSAAVLSGAQEVSRLSDAAEHHRMAVNSFTALGDDRALVAVGPIAGGCWELCGDPAGRELMERSYLTAAALGLRRQEALAATQLGTALARDGKLDQALELLEQGSEILASVGDGLNEAITRGTHTLVLVELGRLDEATSQAIGAIELHQRHGARAWERFVLAVGWWVLAARATVGRAHPDAVRTIGERLDLLVPNWSQPLKLAGIGSGLPPRAARDPLLPDQPADPGVVSELMDTLARALAVMR